MSLSGLHQYLMYHANKHCTKQGSALLLRWSRGDEVHSHAKSYFNAMFGNHYNVDRLALLACQDLVTLKVISIQDSTLYKVFRKSASCYVYLHNRVPRSRIKSRSGLKW